MGEVLSLAAALVWAFAVILLRRSGETVAPFALNLFRVGVSTLLMIVTLAVFGIPLLLARPVGDYVVLVVSGVVGIAVSDTLLHRSLNIVGAGINAIVDCLYAPFVAVFALYWLSERPGGLQIGGMALVIAGVVVSTRAVPPPGTTRRQLLVGIGWGAAAMATLALGIVIAKPVLEGVPVLWAVTVRQVASFAVMAPAAALMTSRRRVWGVFRPDASWRFTLPATILGSYLALMCWIGGMKLTDAGTASILNQTSTIFILVLASAVLHEPFTWRRGLSAVLGVIGILCVTLG